MHPTLGEKTTLSFCDFNASRTFLVVVSHVIDPIADRVAQSLGDTEEVIRKHYAKWTPERRERLRRFTENGLGIEGHKYTVSPEESSTDIQEKEPSPTVEPQLPAPSEKAAATVLDPNFSETGPRE